MINSIIKGLFSMKVMALGMLIFAVSIARATFVESNFGTPASKIAIYDAAWFEFLLFYLALTLIYNIVHYRMFQKAKMATFAFHFAFLIIIVGAGLTRYVGFEGQMRIEEGTSSNIIYTSAPYFTFKANDLVNQFTHDEKKWLSEGVENPFEFDFQLPDQPKVNVKYVSYKENLIDSLVQNDSLHGEAIELFVRGKSKFLFKGSQQQIGATNFSFAKKNPVPGANITEKNGKLFIQTAVAYKRADMSKLTKEDRKKGLDSSQVDVIPADTLLPFYPGQLYMFGQTSLVFKSIRQHVAMKKMKAEEKDAGFNYLTLQLSTKDQTQLVTIQGQSNHILEEQYLKFAGLNFKIGYGAKPVQTPFSIRCNDFQLHHYPGSSMASSFASEVTVIDTLNDVEHKQRIFMNNVMDYEGYRFFQSSYFPDESGTVLSVNYDWWGTTVTYIGYLIMALGMILTLFNPKGRFSELNGLIKKSRTNRSKMLKTVALLFALGLGSVSYAHEGHGEDSLSHNKDSTVAHDHNHAKTPAKNQFSRQKVDVHYLSEKQAEEIEDLLVQDYDGRIIPFHTLSSKLLRKIHRGDTYEGKNAVQTIMALHLYGPNGWYDKKIAYVSSKIRDKLGVGKYLSIDDMEDDKGIFKWMTEYQEAHEKSDGKKGEFDKKLIKLGERYRILKEILQFNYFRVVPVPGDDNGTWVWPFAKELRDKDQSVNVHAINLLRGLFRVSQGEGDFNKAKESLDSLKAKQWIAVKAYEASNDHVNTLTKTHVEVEIASNKFGIFNKIKGVYFTLGLLMLILFFVRTLVNPTKKSEFIFKRVTVVFIAAVAFVFVCHGIGLGMRWYVSGHAPWSNGYEAVVFISWTTLLVGFFFVKKNPAVIAATTLLAAIMLFVTGLNLLDPEITPLQPVLKSYWLMIHVAVITSSYGFLGISSILGLTNMFLYLFKTKSNKKRIQMNIIELTSVSEIIMIVGLFMLTIGTFLGGVWANESWGRYWGWDPKETWALVSVLVFAVIIHLRFIPALSSRFVFNVCSLWGYSAILFTFFGVNFVLVGLHSYAQGDGVAETPTFVIVTIWSFVAFTVGTIVKYLVDMRSKSHS